MAFFDDRDFNQSDSEQSPKFNVYYAVSTDQGATWSNYNLGAGSTVPAFDKQQWGSPGEFGEYTGITTHTVTGGPTQPTTVWIAYTGTKFDGGDHKSVIWVSRVVW